MAAFPQHARMTLPPFSTGEPWNIAEGTHKDNGVQFLAQASHHVLRDNAVDTNKPFPWTGHIHATSLREFCSVHLFQPPGFLELCCPLLLLAKTWFAGE